MDHVGRMTKLRRLMGERGLDAVWLSSPANIRYFSGFTGGSSYLLLLPESAYLITDSRYDEQAAAEAPDWTVEKSQDKEADLHRLGAGAVTWGVEEESLTWGVFRQWQSALPGARAVELSQELSRLRQRKDHEELALMRRALAMTDEAFSYILTVIKPGLRERDIDRELSFFLREKGASGGSFDFIVASGVRSSMPHGTATDKVLETGDFVTMDFGCIYEGYCSDFTRTVCLGEPSAKQREIYDIVLQAQLAGLGALGPGVACREADRVARDLITEAGYGEHFGHGLGHAVGLEIHESPRLSSKSEAVLEPGMVLTVEPGIYLPGWGGVRIEDMALITKNGAEVLTQSSKEFIILK
jgi:Xaa-Pro aminopeptidase